MVSGLMLALTVMLGAITTARAEAIASAQGIFAEVWKRAKCNQPMVEALNSAAYVELGDGYSLGMVLCWLGPYQEGRILFVVAPKTSGRPQPLRFEEWFEGKFWPTDLVWMPDYDSKSRVLSSHQKGRAMGDCGNIGHWLWTGQGFRMTGYWYKADCDGDDFGSLAEFRVFPPRK